MRAGLLNIRHEIMPMPQDVRQTPLRPDLRYLLVQHEKREALMVWVGTERTSLCEASVWVSADGVVLRLCNGRLIGVSEPKRQWQLIDESSLFAENLASPNSRLYKQTTDQQPGFQLGLVRIVEKINVADQDLSNPWIGVHPGIPWTEEIDHLSSIRLALYAESAQLNWMAGQRCMTPDWCLQWQTWPAKPLASKS